MTALQGTQAKKFSRLMRQIQLEEGNEGEQEIHLTTTLPGRILLHWGVEGGADYKGKGYPHALLPAQLPGFSCRQNSCQSMRT